MTDDATRQSPNEIVGLSLDPADNARAEVYALLGHILYQAPSGELLKDIATGFGICNDLIDTDFCRAWREFQHAAATTKAESVKEEFDAVFVGTGRQPVMLYGSFYVAGFLHEKPLAILRDDLAQMGIARHGDRHESEDHISALCDVMRLLITGDAATPSAALELQREFFRRHMAPWYAQLGAAIVGASQTDFYKHVAHVMREFFAIENAAFDIA